MSERTPVSTLEELDTLDDNEIQEGYRDGWGGEPEPGDNRSKSYWHGWRVGMMDGGRLSIDSTHRALVVDFMKRARATTQPPAGEAR